MSDATGRAPIAVARVGGGPLRVRLWSEDLRSLPAQIRADAVRARIVGAGALARGVGGAGIQAVRADGGPGQFMVGVSPGVFVCGAPGSGCPPAERSTAAAGAAGLVLVGVDAPARAARVSLAVGSTADLEVGAGAAAVDLTGAGPTLLVARSPSGAPGLSLPGGWAAQADGAALAVSLDGARAAQVWDGEGGSRLAVRLASIPSPE